MSLSNTGIHYHGCVCLWLRCVPTWRSSNPSQAKNPIIKVPVGEDISQAIVIMVLFRVELQKLLHSDVGEAKRIGPVLFVAGGIYLNKGELSNYRREAGKERHPYTDRVVDSACKNYKAFGIKWEIFTLEETENTPMFTAKKILAAWSLSGQLLYKLILQHSPRGIHLWFTQFFVEIQLTLILLTMKLMFRMPMKSVAW